MAGLPPPPLKDWERPDKLNVELIGHGRQQKRVIVRLHLPKGRDRGPIQLTAALIIRDMKHSKGWKCECTGSLKRLAPHRPQSMLSQPMFDLQLHFVCDMDERHVREGIKEVHDYMNMGPGESAYPLAGSCHCCERDETAGKDALKRCSACKLTRYCSTECQRKDWPRHKVACRMVHSVDFEAGD
ncbi:hypothetical protein BV20DRAFT_1037768 [Pilatotrama ljubarskyi]|nr:hypothetical protein BV20DRAFT_1037768 [Pilatotrama ljubarskyi]